MEHNSGLGAVEKIFWGGGLFACVHIILTVMSAIFLDVTNS
jgi:hypothetical protein